MKQIAIIILNWNGKNLLEKFLPSVIEHSTELSNIYVADNASTDDSIKYVKENYPKINIIQNKENGGYALGYNLAIKNVTEPYLCLLNNDVEVSENWLSPILEKFEKENNTVILQPKIKAYKNKSFFEYAGAAGGFIDKLGYPYCKGRIFNSIEEDKGQYNTESDIFWASGACFFIRRETFNKLNGFDEDFFAHMEEIDLCWRALNMGYKIKYIPSSSVYHLGGGTLDANNPKKTFLNVRNSLFTLVKNSNKPLQKVFLRMVLDGIMAIYFLFSEKGENRYLNVFAILKAHFSFYKNLFTMIKKRKNLKYLIKTNVTSNETSILWKYFIQSKRNFKQL